VKCSSSLQCSSSLLRIRIKFFLFGAQPPHRPYLKRLLSSGDCKRAVSLRNRLLFQIVFPLPRIPASSCPADFSRTGSSPFAYLCTKRTASAKGTASLTFSFLQHDKPPAPYLKMTAQMRPENLYTHKPRKNYIRWLPWILIGPSSPRLIMCLYHKITHLSRKFSYIFIYFPHFSFFDLFVFLIRPFTF
jgi:hypothetical protein